MVRAAVTRQVPYFDLSDVLDSMSDGLLAADAEGEIHMCNSAAASLLGLATADLAIGRALGDLVPPPRGEWKDIAEQTFSGSSADGFEIQLLARDVVIRLAAVGAGSSTPGLLIQIRDVTETRNLEREVLRKRQELERVNVDLERSNRDLERFAHAASHDMQEPLRMVHSYVALLARRYKGQLDADADEFIDYAMDGAERMRLMINSLLDLSQVMRAPLTVESIGLEEIVGDVLSDLQTQINETGASVRVGPLPTVAGNPVQLRRVFQNLVSNSMKYRSELAPEVTIDAARGDGEWIVTITDNGKGIAADAHEFVFEPFKRLQRQRGVPGSGLGLATARAIVERYRGRIWIRPAHEQGTAISFTILERAAS